MYSSAFPDWGSSTKGLFRIDWVSSFDGGILDSSNRVDSSGLACPTVKDLLARGQRV